MSYKPVTHVLFDMDGLILNTEEFYTIGHQEVVSRYNQDLTFELKSKIMGKQTIELARDVINELDLPITVEEFIVETRKILDKLFLQTKVLPGVEKLLLHLHKHNIPMGLATGSSKETYNLKVKNHHELFELFSYKTWGSSDPDVKRGKPYPDIFLVAAAKFPDKPSPDKCLVFEDSVNGVKAAVAAGMQVLMVPDPRLNRELASEATLVLSSMEEFRPEVFGLPPFDD